MRISNLFRLSYWLDPAVLAQRAGPAMWLLVALGLLWCIACALMLARRRLAPDIASAQLLAGALLAAVALGRLFATPVLGLRIGWLIAAGVALSPFAPRLLRQAMRDGAVGDCLRAVSFGAAPAHPWGLGTALAWLGLHVAATAAVMSIVKQPVWLALALVALILAPVGIALAVTWLQRPHSAGAGSPPPAIELTPLAPLLLVYAVLAARLAASAVARFTIGQFRVVDPFSALFNLPLALIVMSAYGLVLSARQALCPGRAAPGAGTDGREARFVKIAALALIAGTVTWATWNALELHTRGVTGSDPYAYAQMGVDLAQHGTVFHSFPLIRLTYGLSIPSEPIIHVGYKLPQDVRRIATTVWPPGYAAFTALGYKLAGEPGLYLVTPLLSLLSLAVIGWLALMLARNTRDHAFGWAIAALSIFLTASSYQQVEWQLVPMADIASQLFSLLALSLALLVQPIGRPPGGRQRVYILAVLSGLALGVAFDIRYTQVLIAPAIAFALSAGRRPRLAQGMMPLIACAIAAAIAVAPVLIYHSVAFGSPLRTGSEELSNFSLPQLPQTLARITTQLASPREFGLLLPFIFAGAAVLWRQSRRALATVGLYCVPLFLLHIAYAYLRPRDILSLFPILSILAALGAGWLALWLIASVDGLRPLPALLRRLAAIAVLVALSFAFVLRSMDTLALPITHGFGAFGYLVREQRDSFTRLGQLLPANAVVGCSLNSGAVDLYAGRLTFRPATWTPEQLLKFVDALRQENTPVYILADGDEVQPAVVALRQRFQLDEIARLDMPYYFPGSGSENRKVALYRVDV